MNQAIARWQNIPNPCCDASMLTVFVETAGIRHVKDHFSEAKGEPWSSWLPESLLSELRNAVDVQLPGNDYILQFAEFLEADVREACKEKRALSFHRRRTDSNESRWPHRWLLALPSGTICVLQTRSHSAIEQSLITCYFLDATFDAKDAAEATVTVQSIMATRYCRYEVSEGRTRQVRRKSTETVSVFEAGTSIEEHTGFVFCSNENWGFDAHGVFTRRFPPYGRMNCFPLNKHGVRRREHRS